MAFKTTLFLVTFVATINAHRAFGAIALDTGSSRTTACTPTRVNLDTFQTSMTGYLARWGAGDDVGESLRKAIRLSTMPSDFYSSPSCLTFEQSDDLFKIMALLHPQRNPLPPIIPGSTSWTMPPSSRRIQEIEAVEMPTATRIQATVDSTNIGACATFPTYSPGVNITVAYPPCAAQICLLYGNPQNFQGLQTSCVANYNLGAYANVYTWWYPFSSCTGSSCPH